MPANDERFRALAKRGRGRVWDETIRLSPMLKGRSDPNRPQTLVKAAVRQGAEAAQSLTGGTARDWSLRVGAGPTEARITRATYAGPAIMVGDKVRRMDRAGQPLYEVAIVNDRDEGDIVLTLNQA